jgi:hypothetical protein
MTNLFINFIERRIDAAFYALACDDEANHHYNLTPCKIYRAKLVLKAIFIGKKALKNAS